MEETLVPSVFWMWLMGNVIWLGSLFRLRSWGPVYPSPRSVSRIRRARRWLTLLLLAALAVILLNSPSFSLRNWLLPIHSLNQAAINEAGMFIIRIAILWLVFMILKRERTYRFWRRERTLTVERLRYWEPFYNRQVLIACAGLLLGLFITFSSVVSALLCLAGWWVSYTIWQVYSRL